MTGLAAFAAQLVTLGYEATEHDGGRVSLPWEVTLGRLASNRVRLGFVIFDDFPVTPPTGPHVSPTVLPFNQQGGLHPTASIHPSPFGGDWQYWSRPFPTPPGWTNTDRSVKTYLKHIENLFRTL